MQTKPRPRPSSPIARRPARRATPRRATPRRTTPHLRRRQPQQSTAEKALKTITGLFGGGKAAKKGAPGKRKQGAAGFAALAGAAGLAFKNRDKLGGLFGRKRDEDAGSHEPAVPHDPAAGHPLDDRPMGSAPS